MMWARITRSISPTVSAITTSGLSLNPPTSSSKYVTSPAAVRGAVVFFLPPFLATCSLQQTAVLTFLVCRLAGLYFLEKHLASPYLFGRLHEAHTPWIVDN